MAMNVVEAHAWECWGPLDRTPRLKEVGYVGFIYFCPWCEKLLH